MSTHPRAAWRMPLAGVCLLLSLPLASEAQVNSRYAPAISKGLFLELSQPVAEPYWASYSRAMTLPDTRPEASQQADREWPTALLHPSLQQDLLETLDLVRKDLQRDPQKSLASRPGANLLWSKEILSASSPRSAARVSSAFLTAAKP